MNRILVPTIVGMFLFDGLVLYTINKRVFLPLALRLFSLGGMASVVPREVLLIVFRSAGFSRLPKLLGTISMKAPDKL